MIGLSECRQKVVRGELRDHFCSMSNFLPSLFSIVKLALGAWLNSYFVYTACIVNRIAGLGA